MANTRTRRGRGIVLSNPGLADGAGRALRAALHRNGASAMTHNPDLKTLAKRLKAKGKHGQAIISAVPRKLSPASTPASSKTRFGQTSSLDRDTDGYLKCQNLSTL